MQATSPCESRYPRLGNTFLTESTCVVGSQAQGSSCGARPLQRRHSWSCRTIAAEQDSSQGKKSPTPEAERECDVEEDCSRINSPSCCSTLDIDDPAFIEVPASDDCHEEAEDVDEDFYSTDSEFEYGSCAGHTLDQSWSNGTTSTSPRKEAPQPCPAAIFQPVLGVIAVPWPISTLPVTVTTPGPTVAGGPAAAPTPTASSARQRKGANAERPVAQAVTTLMIRGLPPILAQQDFLDELDSSGFSGTYDFVYMPRDFKTGECQGKAFVNFDSPDVAAAFAVEWHKQRRFGLDTTLSVTNANLQGKEDNMKKWDQPRLRRIRNPDFHPFVREAGSKTARPSSPPAVAPAETASKRPQQPPTVTRRTGPAGLPQRAPEGQVRSRLNGSRGGC